MFTWGIQTLRSAADDDAAYVAFFDAHTKARTAHWAAERDENARLCGAKFLDECFVQNGEDDGRCFRAFWALLHVSESWIDTRFSARLITTRETVMCVTGKAEFLGRQRNGNLVKYQGVEVALYDLPWSGKSSARQKHFVAFNMCMSDLFSRPVHRNLAGH